MKRMKDEVEIRAGKHVVTPSYTQKLLGAHVAEDLGWKEHILNNNDSLINQLNSRINGLSLVSKLTSFRD